MCFPVYLESSRISRSEDRAKLNVSTDLTHIKSKWSTIEERELSYFASVGRHCRSNYCILRAWALSKSGNYRILGTLALSKGGNNGPDENHVAGREV